MGKKIESEGAAPYRHPVIRGAVPQLRWPRGRGEEVVKESAAGGRGRRQEAGRGGGRGGCCGGEGHGAGAWNSDIRGVGGANRCGELGRGGAVERRRLDRWVAPRWF
jgi:hypothetical protein